MMANNPRGLKCYFMVPSYFVTVVVLQVTIIVYKVLYFESFDPLIISLSIFFDKTLPLLVEEFLFISEVLLLHKNVYRND
jgi:hypothetical protein